MYITKKYQLRLQNVLWISIAYKEAKEDVLPDIEINPRLHENLTKGEGFAL